MSKATALRNLLNQPGKLVMAPGAYDAWSARLVEKAGFDAVYMTGYGVSASVLGKPDIGLLTMSEMAAAARNMNFAVDVPVIADADNGYGGALNVARTIREYESAGIAGIQLEDQIFPKRCGHMEGKQIIPLGEMLAKLRAAVHARSNPDTVIIARTDARAVEGFDAALERAKAFEAAGADVVFFEAPQSLDEMRAVAQAIRVPLLANMVENGKTPLLTAGELVDLGYRLSIYPVTTLYAATKVVADALATLKEAQSNAPCMELTVDFPTFNSMIGLDEIRALEKSFSGE